MQNIKPLLAILEPNQLETLIDLSKPYKRAKVLIPLSQELDSLKDIYCGFKAPVPIKGDFSIKTTQPTLKLKTEVKCEDRRVNYTPRAWRREKLRQTKLSATYRQTKSRRRKQLVDDSV
jgi:hypothetical protein